MANSEQWAIKEGTLDPCYRPVARTTPT